jgi:RNA polymerase sigma-70 factor (ECF subfamily)
MAGNEEAELAALLRAAIDGDARAYTAFLGRVAGRVRSLARRKITRGGVDPEDIVQETLLAIHAKRHTWMTDAPVLPWVNAIAQHKLVDAFRRRGRRMEVDIDDVATTLAEPETETVLGRDVERALGALAPGQRLVVSAIAVEGCSIGEAARKLGMTETAVRVALHRGLKAIAMRFGQAP